jgi:hypothetical protein
MLTVGCCGTEKEIEMSSTSDEEQDPEKERDALIANMKTRIEQAQASGQSPEQIREQIIASAREEAPQQVQQIVAKTRSWWFGFRNFLIVGALALGLAISLALFVDNSYASPLCKQYAAQHNLVFRGLEYPVIGNSSSTTSSGSCIFDDTAGNRNTIRFSKLEPNSALALLASFGLQIEITLPTSFIVIALIAVAISKLR